MDPNKGYWHRQFYFLSSLGIFYLILIALFAIPLLGTVVVILIKGALDLRYVIIGLGCVGLIALGWMLVKVVNRLWHRFRQDGTLAGRELKRNLMLGRQVEVSIFNGMLKFSCGRDRTDSHTPLPHNDRQMLLPPTTQSNAVSILDQLQHLSDLKQTGAIDADEFNMLKAMLFDASPSTGEMNEKDRG